jgi:hypothetical protein
MGFFSWNCIACGHPLLSLHASSRINAWMVHGIAITPRGRLIRGRRP